VQKIRPFVAMSPGTPIRQIGQTAAMLIALGCYGTPRSGHREVDAAMCADASKLCDGKCIPASACCGPCSCDGLPQICGPNADENCCTAGLVTGGTFNRDNEPSYPAILSDFRLDRFEVTADGSTDSLPLDKD
jgi:hypothetical protein